MTIEEMKAAQTRAVNEARQVAHDLVDREPPLLRAVLWEIAIQLALQIETMKDIASTRGDPR